MNNVVEFRAAWCKTVRNSDFEDGGKIGAFQWCEKDISTIEKKNAIFSSGKHCTGGGYKRPNFKKMRIGVNYNNEPMHGKYLNIRCICYVQYIAGRVFKNWWKMMQKKCAVMGLPDRAFLLFGLG
jgi:hypothetical protein